MNQMKCQHCDDGTMKKASKGNITGLVFGLILIVLGIVVFFLIPLFGWVAGPIIGIFGLTRGGKRVWKCSDCGFYMPRV